MKFSSVSFAAVLLAASAAVSAQSPAPGVPAGAPLRPAVHAGNTLYISGSLDRDPSGKVGSTPEESAKFVLDNIKKELEDAGYTMDDLVQVQIFCTDLSYFQAFNPIYKSYFKDQTKLPARAFLGVKELLGGGHFEVMGIAVKGHK
jgi:2-iminobutanoate/2-iminopropanoate deaminase